MNNKLDILVEVAPAEGMFLSGLVEAMKVIKISTNFCKKFLELSRVLEGARLILTSMLELQIHISNNWS